MKKTLLALGATLVLGLAACDPDDSKTATPGGGASSGEYTPTVKIASISDDDDIDRWNWASDKVTSIDHYEGATLRNTTTFTYDGNQLTKIDLPGSESIEFAYSGGKISHVTMAHHDLPMPMSMAVSYNGDAMSGLSMPISEAMVQQLIGEILGEVLNGGGMDFKGGKATGGSVQVDLTWNGNNVSRKVNTMSLTYDLPVEQLLNLANAMMGSEIAQYAELIRNGLAMMGMTAVPLNLTIADTIDFTHDQNNNPMHGFLGGFEDPESLPGLLSRNNIVSTHQYGSTSYHLELGALAAMLPEQYAQMVANTMPRESDRENYTYQYNAKGYPTSVTSSYGDVKQFTYIE